MAKIEKRYQLFGRNGIEWSPWFTLNIGDKNVTTLEPCQFDNKLKNEYRKIDDDGNITPIKIPYRASNKIEPKKK